MPDSVEGLRKLAQRLLASPNPDGSRSSARLLPGRLPDDPDLNIPLPPNSTLVGSMTRTQGEKPQHVEVVLDAPGKETEILSFYEQELQQRGWRRTTPFAAHGGFTSMGFGTGHMFSKGEDGRMISVIIVPEEDGSNDVRVRTQTQWIVSGARGMNARAAGLLPALRPPVGMRFWAGGGGGSDNRWHSEAEAETEKPVAELEAHFAQQLITAGWVRVAGGSTGPLAWSTWTVPGEGEWHGYLFVLDAPGKDRRFLSVRVESATMGPPGYGSSTWAATRLVKQ